MNAANKAVQEQNDLFRKFPDTKRGKFVITPAVAEMSPEEQDEILRKVRNFDRFAPENDPCGRHDFGAFDHRGRRILWKIDYYDPGYRTGPEEPQSPKATRRMLTIMLAEEY